MGSSLKGTMSTPRHFHREVPLPSNLKLEIHVYPWSLANKF